MTQYIIIFAFFIVAFVFFGLSLHFSKYKRRKSGCCGGGHCDSPDGEKHVSCGCYDEKVKFVKNFEKISE
ncbi:hypothetical protein JXQ31_04195 [candidate division KSB1 bacterium]|nr:hypothetical protein [candidate division KSB1 bacterium]